MQNLIKTIIPQGGESLNRMNSLLPVEQKLVNFNGAEIMVIKCNDSKIRVGVRWVCSGLGFDENQYRTQIRKIQDDVVLQKGVTKMSLPTTGGAQEIICLELSFLPLWLAKINANIIDNPEVQDRLVDYQLNAKDVLSEAFLENHYKSPIQSLSPQLQLLISIELKQDEMKKAIEKNKEAVQSIRDVVSLSSTSWRGDTGRLITRMAQKLGGNEHIRDLRTESYRILDARMGVCLETRLTNKRRRMAEEGICKSKRDGLNPLDVIVDDKKLIEGYVAIVKEMAMKYGI